MNQPIHLLNLISKEKLDNILRVFAEVTDIAAIISDADGRPITEPHNFKNLCLNYCRSTERGRQKCYESDCYGGRESARLKKSVMYDCLNAGLLDAASPIIVGENHLGNILCGQVLEKPIKTDIAVKRARAIEITDIEGYLKELENIPIMSRERFSIIINFMEVITHTISELALEKYISSRNSQRYVNKLINGVSDCIISMDVNGKILTANKAGVAMFGYEAEKLIEQPVFSLFSDAASIGACKERVNLGLKGKGHDELSAVNAAGKEFPVQVSLAKIFDEANEHSGYVAVLRDISEEKRTERTKEDLFGMLTHDMGNPILSIKKAIQLLLDGTLGPLNKNQTDIMRLSLGSSHQLLGMVTDILDIYRSENGKFTLHKVLIDMNHVLKEGIKQIKFRLINDKSATICFEPSAPPLNLPGDQIRLMRMCINLLDNAIKYSPDGGEIEVTSAIITGGEKEKAGTTIEPLAYHHIQSGKQYFLGTVIDRGLGIPEQYQQSIFDKFFIVGSGDQRGRKGMGLGLTFCKQVVEAHGGFIWVQSPFIDSDGKKQQGCRFSFTLPVNPVN